MRTTAAEISERVRIIRSMLRLGAFLQREGNRLLQDYSLGQQQFVVLKYIEERGPVSQKDVCTDLLYEKSNVSKMISKLHAAQLIRVSASETDSRITLLSTTGKGKETVSLCMKRLRSWNKTWLSVLTDDEIRTANRVFDTLLNNIN